MILVSSLGRAFWTAWNADSMSGMSEAVGVPTVRLAYSSAKKRRHILDTHWLELPILIVIFARFRDLSVQQPFHCSRVGALKAVQAKMPYTPSKCFNDGGHVDIPVMR